MSTIVVWSIVLCATCAPSEQVRVFGTYRSLEACQAKLADYSKDDGENPWVDRGPPICKSYVIPEKSK